MKYLKIIEADYGPPFVKSMRNVVETTVNSDVILWCNMSSNILYNATWYYHDLWTFVNNINARNGQYLLVCMQVIRFII